MGLNINIDAIEGVLLADGWHMVADESFDIDDYEFSGEGGSFEADAAPRMMANNEKLLPRRGAVAQEISHMCHGHNGELVAIGFAAAYQYFRLVQP